MIINYIINIYNIIFIIKYSSYISLLYNNLYNKMIKILAFFLILIHLSNSKEISPRQLLQDYLYQHNCKIRFLNKIIINEYNGKKQFRNIIELLKHSALKYKDKDILYCYNILLYKDMNEKLYEYRRNIYY